MSDKIRITLQSDLCVSSGYSFAGIIDSDICYDSYGFPYIPAKRIKGCLREVAYLIHSDRVEELFGMAGNNGICGMTIGNAVLVGSKEKQAAIDSYNADCDNQTDRLTKEFVLERYTHVKAQTRIDEEGLADDNSLRYTRVVNQYDPDTGEELVFEAKVELLNHSLEDELARCCKGLRHIGLNRNRGLGVIQCEYQKGTEVAQSDRWKLETLESDKEYELQYRICNVAPLVISGEKDNITETYIKGSNIIGCLADAYLKDGQADETFEKLFVNGSVNYSNLYPCYDNRIYYPAPNGLKRRKISGELLFENNPDHDMNKDSENQAGQDVPKLLNGKYVAWYQDSGKDIYDIREVETEIVYHHRHHMEGMYASEEDAMLYTMEVIKSGQYFGGTITGKGALLSQIIELITHNTLYIGKSRSAQYGQCVLESIQCVEKPQQRIRYKEGDNLFVMLQSDGIFMDPKTGYSVVYDQVRQQIINELGLLVEEDSENCLSSLKTVRSTGYYSVWNLKKQAIPAIKRGSSFVFRMKNAGEVTLHNVGERTMEGYGQIEVRRGEDIKKPNKQEEQARDFTGNTKVEPVLQKFIQQKKKQTAWETLKVKALQNNRINISSSLLGRVTLMLTESMDLFTTSSEVMMEFERRVSSISRDKEREEAKKVLMNARKECDGAIQQELLPMYLLEVLVATKYSKSIEKKAERGGRKDA